MKLNPDCVRDILIEVENVSTPTLVCTIDKDSLSDTLGKYSWLEIVYHINQCEMADLIYGVLVFESDGYADISDLTPYGHEFLANIRKDTNWNKTKTIAEKIGSFSLSALKDIASNVIATAISTQFK